MPRARTGSLAYKRTTGWNARVWVPVKSLDETVGEERRWVPLDTHDEDLAKRKMAKIVALIATGEYSIDEMKRTAVRVQTCREEMVSFIAKGHALVPVSKSSLSAGAPRREEQSCTLASSCGADVSRESAPSTLNKRTSGCAEKVIESRICQNITQEFVRTQMATHLEDVECLSRCGGS